LSWSSSSAISSSFGLVTTLRLAIIARTVCRAPCTSVVDGQR
jgi:hypothetical protein